MRESRSAAGAREEQLHLDGVPPPPAQGVGGRQAPGRRRRRGGGYLDERTSSQVRRERLLRVAAAGPWEEAKLRELEVMGLPGVWIEVARAIGFESFLTLWRILDRAEQLRSESESMIEVKLRRLASYHRYQRNRFIEALVSAGLDDREIQARVAAELGESLSLSHIFRLAGRRRVRG